MNPCFGEIEDRLHMVRNRIDGMIEANRNHQQLDIVDLRISVREIEIVSNLNNKYDLTIEAPKTSDPPASTADEKPSQSSSPLPVQSPEPGSGSVTDPRSKQEDPPASGVTNQGNATPSMENSVAETPAAG